MELQVGVKVFLQNEDGKYLLLHRNTEKYKNTKGTWDIVGGRIERGTPLIENLKREVSEEVSLEIVSEPRLIFAQDIFVGEENHVVRLTYTAKTNGEPVLDVSENDFCVWLTIDEIRAYDDLDIYVTEILKKDLLK